MNAPARPFLDSKAIEDLNRTCDVASRRARWAVAAIAVTSLLDAVPDTSSPTEATSALGVASFLATVFTAVLFLRWLHRAIANALPLRSPGLRWRPAQCVTAFIIPIVSLYRPYQIVRDLNFVSDPADLALPTVLRERASADYRSQALEAAPPPKPTPSAPVGIWWALWLGSTVSTAVAVAAVRGGWAGIVVATAVNVALGAAAVLVVTRIDRRQRERLRRLSALRQPSESVISIASSPSG